MKEVLKKIPWMKITAPMIPLVLVDYSFGKFMINLHSLNLQHGVTDRFPTNKSFYIFLFGNLLIMGVYLLMSVSGQFRQEKIEKIRAEIKLNAATKIQG